MTRHAHRDPLVFPKPDEFRPQRWNKEYVHSLLVYLFAFIHSYIGLQFALIPNRDKTMFNIQELKSRAVSA